MDLGPSPGSLYTPMYEDDEMYGIIDEDEMAMVDEVFGTFDYL
jgi:hypothetical protein